MRLTGDIKKIKQKRDDQNKDIAIEVDKIEYITYKKDGKYFQPFDFTDELDIPFVLTGDLLARNISKYTEEGEHQFHVYDLVDDEYILNPDKQLLLNTAFDFDLGQMILTFVHYTITVSNEEFKQLKSNNAKSKRQQKGRK